MINHPLKTTHPTSLAAPVVFVTNSLKVGGSERNLVVLSKGLPTNLTREIWSFKSTTENSFEASCPVRYFSRFLKFDPILILRLVWIMAFHPARTFHIYHFAFGIHVLLANLRLFWTRKLIFSFGSGRDEISQTVFKIYASLINHFADVVTSNSESTSLDLVRDGIRADKIQIVENGYELDTFQFKKHDPQAMASAISTLVTNGKFADLLAQEAYRRASSRFGSDKMTNRFLEIYESIQ